MEPLELLASVAREGRYLVGESPEQVGQTVGMSGRTIRRIEDPHDKQRPRRLTVETLAHYYSLDAELLVLLATSDVAPDELDRQVRERALQAGVSAGGGLAQVALALARVDSKRYTSLPEDEAEFISSFRRLDPLRRRIAAVTLQQLLLAQAEDRRRRESSADQPD